MSRRKNQSVSKSSNKENIARLSSDTKQYQSQGNFRYKPLGYSTIMNQARNSLIHKRAITEAAEDINDLESQIKSLQDQNEQLQNTTDTRSSKKPSFVKTFTSQTFSEIKPSLESTYGIDLQRLINRIERLEYTIESQRQEIEYLRSNNQQQTERTFIKQQEEMKNLGHMNSIYSDLLMQQRLEVENYKHLILVNNELKSQNQILQAQLQQTDSKIQEFEQDTKDVQKKISLVLKENFKLKELIKIPKSQNKETTQLLAEKDNQIKHLRMENEILIGKLKLEEEENQYLRTLKIQEMKSFIQNSCRDQQNKILANMDSVKSEDVMIDRQNESPNILSILSKPQGKMLMTIID